MPFTSINKIISKKFKQSPLAKNVTAALVCDEFDKLLMQIFGKKMENMAQAMYLKNNVLTVACLSPVVAQEVKMREEELKQKINQKFGGQGIVERLRLLT